MNRWTCAEVLAFVAFLAAAAMLAPVAEAAEKQYSSTIIRGKLEDSRSRQPLGNARVRLVPTDEEGQAFETVSDEEGRFELSGVPYGLYAVSIVTETGVKINGINSLTVNKDKQAVGMSVSARVDSTTELRNEPDLFVATVDVDPHKWKRFWRQFAIFIGAAAVGGAAAL